MYRLPSDLDAHFADGGTLVVPTRARARAVSLAHAAARLESGLAVWASPDVLPLSAWVRREAERTVQASPGSAPRVLAPVEEWYLWRSCTREAVRELVLLDADALAESLRRAEQLAQDYRITIAAGAPGSESALLLQVRGEFQARCRALNAATPAAVFDARSADPARIWWRGFATLPPALAQFARPQPPAATATAALLRPSEATAEAEEIAAWCAQRLRQDPRARLLVLAAGPAGTRERLAAFIRGAIDAHGTLSATQDAAGWAGIEGGDSLARLPVIAQALMTLDLLAGRPLQFEALAAWLRAGEWAAPAVRAHLSAALRAHGFLSLSLRELLPALASVPRPLRAPGRALAAQLAASAVQLGEGRAAPRLWAERFRAALRTAVSPGVPGSDSAARLLPTRWHEVLEEFGQLSGSVPLLARAEALTLLRELAGRSPAGVTPEDPSVTLSAALADPVVCYDGIWVAGVSADVLPQPLQTDPFLPVSAQQAAGVPAASAEGRLREARALLHSWQACTAELKLSVPQRAQDLEVPLSPLLHEVPLAASGARIAALALRLRRAGESVLFEDERGVPWDPRQRLPGTRSIELQNSCPFRAYAELRLGAAAAEIAEPGIPATQRGVLLHAALEMLWNRLHDSHTLAQLSPAQLDELITASVEQASASTLLQPRRGRRARAAARQLTLFSAVPPLVAREQRRAVRLIRRLCALERERAPFTVEQVETDVLLSVGGATVRVRPDRVDRLGDGSRAVLDYKTGAHAARVDLESARPTHPQLLVYAQVIEQVSALATVNVAAREVRYQGIARVTGLLPKVRALSGAAAAAEAWELQQRLWRSKVEELVRGFLGGDAAIDPRPGACTFCQVADICRIGERQRSGEEPDEL